MSDTQSLFQDSTGLEVEIADHPIYARTITDSKDYCWPCSKCELHSDHVFVCTEAHDTYQNQWPCVYDKTAKAVACARRVLVDLGPGELV